MTLPMQSFIYLFFLFSIYVYVIKYCKIQQYQNVEHLKQKRIIYTAQTKEIREVRLEEKLSTKAEKGKKEELLLFYVQYLQLTNINEKYNFDFK